MSKLILMCGVPGSGKSTWIKNNKSETDLWISRDKIRFEKLKERFKCNNIFLDNKMIALINTYLTGSTGKNDNRENKFWSSNNIDINWNCQQIHKWATEHPHLIPTPGKNIAKKQIMPNLLLSAINRNTLLINKRAEKVRKT